MKRWDKYEEMELKKRRAKPMAKKKQETIPEVTDNKTIIGLIIFATSFAVVGLLVGRHKYLYATYHLLLTLSLLVRFK